MSLILKMQINDQSENKYIFSTEGGEIQLIPLSVVENGEYTPEEGQAFSTVTVNVPATILEHLNITSNGTYEASSGHAYDVVTVNVQPILDILVDTVNENGTYVYEPDEGYDGLEEVRVTVSVPEPVFEHLTRTITSNGTYNYTPSSGKDGFDEANITVSVPTPQPSLEQKSEYYNANGTYTVQPSQGYDGISEVEVEVDVQGGGPTPIVGTLDLTGFNKISQNGTFNFSPSTFNWDYFDGASIDVDVPQSSSGTVQVQQFYAPSNISDRLAYVDFQGVANKIIKGVLIFATNGVASLNSRVERYGILGGCCLKGDGGTPTYPSTATFPNSDKGLCCAYFKSSSSDGSAINASGQYSGIYSQYNSNNIGNSTGSFMKICPNNRVGLRVRQTSDTSGHGLLVGVDYTVVAWFD